MSIKPKVQQITAPKEEIKPIVSTRQAEANAIDGMKQSFSLMDTFSTTGKKNDMISDVAKQKQKPKTDASGGTLFSVIGGGN